MAICNALTAAVSKSCDTNIGGIKQMFIADWSELALTLDSNGMITNFNSTSEFFLANNTAFWSTQNIGGGTYALNTVGFPGNYTSLLNVGDLVTATYYDVFGNNYTIVFPILSWIFTGTNTIITPDWVAYGLQPVVSTTVNISITNQDVFIGKPFFEFEFNKNTSNLEETMVSEQTNAATLYTQTVNLVLNRRDKLKREAIIKLYSGVKKLNIVVLDSNNNAWLVGNEFGAYLTGLAGGTGSALSDKNSYDLSFIAESSEPARAMDTALLAQTYFIKA